jgi:hypothetical protein
VSLPGKVACVLMDGCEECWRRICKVDLIKCQRQDSCPEVKLDGASSNAADLHTFCTHKTKPIVSCVDKSHNLEIAALCAVHMYTHVPNLNRLPDPGHPKLNKGFCRHCEFGAEDLRVVRGLHGLNDSSVVVWRR